LLIVDLVDGGQIRVATVTNPTIGVAVVPEPSTIMLLVLGGLLLVRPKSRPRG